MKRSVRRRTSRMRRACRALRGEHGPGVSLPIPGCTRYHGQVAARPRPHNRVSTGRRHSDGQRRHPTSRLRRARAMTRATTSAATRRAEPSSVSPAFLLPHRLHRATAVRHDGGRRADGGRLRSRLPVAGRAHLRGRRPRHRLLRAGCWEPRPTGSDSGPCCWCSPWRTGRCSLLFTFVVYGTAADGFVLLAAVGIGATAPQVAPLSRSRLVTIISDRMPEGRRAKTVSGTMAYESAADETVFVFGPFIVGILASAITPWAPLVGAAVLTVVFVGAFALHPSGTARVAGSGFGRQGAVDRLRAVPAPAADRGRRHPRCRDLLRNDAHLAHIVHG